MEINIKEQIKNDYVNNFLSNYELSKKYGVHRTTIQKILKSEGILLRKKTPLIKVNHFFFSEYTSITCYWAGFILADGYIRTKNRFTLEIKLQKKDINHLIKFKNDIGYCGKIIEKPDYVVISISSSQLVNDLEKNFGIKNKKSLTCEVSPDIPETMLKDYIRGYFDGDGSITYTSIETINLLGTNRTISFIRDYFFNLGIRLRSKDKPDICKNKNVFVINYSGYSAYKCLSHLYENSIRFLDRKMTLYTKVKNKYE